MAVRDRRQETRARSMKAKRAKGRAGNSAVSEVVLPGIHYTAEYLINPMHPVTVNLIGVGGNGSQMLNNLARMDSALKALGHTGLHVRAIDPDKVSVANMGRQLFSPADVDNYKCTVLVGRINRFFGTRWEAVPQLYTAACKVPPANITISCVDSGGARKEIWKALDAHSHVDKQKAAQPYNRLYYWMDLGNMMDRGQVVIGTLGILSQPEDQEYRCAYELPHVGMLHPDIFKDGKGDDQGPSCSLAEALGRQDLTINSNLANMGWALLWKMFREARVRYHGLYLNLETMVVTPIRVTPNP